MSLSFSFSFSFRPLRLIAFLALAGGSLLAQSQAPASRTLPFDRVFIGQERFEALVDRAQEERWADLPIGERTATVGRALLGTPYTSFTLEIDDRVEAVSVNFDGLDCWTFFETALAFARMIKDCQMQGRRPAPRDLLYWIEQDRYRGGQCTGDYLSRLHFLEEWSADNEKRGLTRNITREIGGQPMGHRQVRDMSAMWKSYRYLRHNPSLLPRLKEIESANSDLTVYHIPKSKVGDAEAKMQSGDIICITTTWKGSYTSHVGLAYRDSKGVLRFMHATSDRKKGRKVIIDARLKEYLYSNSDHAGVFVVRPRDVPGSAKAPSPPPG
jgi:Protein of unknown function (DUF1460)